MTEYDFLIRKDIIESRINKCLICGAKQCVKSHSVSKKMYLSKIADDSHVFGAFRQKGLGKFELISINEASTFYNFCKECDAVFFALDNNVFIETNKEQIFLLYYRMFASQIHQIKEEIIFFEKYALLNYSQKNKRALKKYLPKFEYFNEMLKQKTFDIFNFKLIKLDLSIEFVYFNIINVQYDLKCNYLKDCNELGIGVFCENNQTNILFIWEKENESNLSKYINQINLLNLKELEIYLTNIMIAFPFNLFINPSFYLKWKHKNKFEEERNRYAKYLNTCPDILFNIFFKQKINIFE